MVEVFGEIDRDKMGNVISGFPAWYNEAHRDELVNETEQLEGALNGGYAGESSKPQLIAKIEENKKKLHLLDKAKPKLNGGQKEAVAKIWRELGEKIREALISYDVMKRGYFDSRKEADTSTLPCIGIRDKMMEFAKSCNVKVEKGKVSRTGAEKMWKIAGKLLGEEYTNTEVLRRVN